MDEKEAMRKIGNLGLGFADEISELVDGKTGNIDVCHVGVPRGVSAGT